MSFTSVLPPVGFGCSCLAEAVADVEAPFTFDEELQEFELRARAGSIGAVYYCPFCGERTPESRRGSSFLELDDAEQARLDALTDGIQSEADMRSRFGAPDWELRALIYRDLCPTAVVHAQFSSTGSGIVLMPRPNAAFVESVEPPLRKEGGSLTTGCDEQTGLRNGCGCGQFPICAADPQFGLTFRDGVFELHTPGWRRQVLYCWFCGGTAPTTCRTPRYLHADLAEELRIKALAADMRTPEDAVRIFGPADREISKVCYECLSPMASVSGRTVDGEWMGLCFDRKSIRSGK